MFYTFTHQIQFKSGNETKPYRSLGYWKTAKGALKAAERHAMEIQVYYEADSIAQHALVVRDSEGKFVTNEAF